MGGSKKRLRLFILRDPVCPATCWERQRSVCQAWCCRKRWKARTSCHNHIADKMEISYINAMYFVLLCASPADSCLLFWTCSGVQAGSLQEMAKKQLGCNIYLKNRCWWLYSFCYIPLSQFFHTGLGMSSCFLNFVQPKILKILAVIRKLLPLVYCLQYFSWCLIYSSKTFSWFRPVCLYICIWKGLL